jgi:hypothetical protein
MTGLLVIWLMPGDIIVMLTVATNLEHNDARLVAALPFIVATVLVVRDWMNTHSWLLNIITCGVFIALIL